MIKAGIRTRAPNFWSSIGFVFFSYSPVCDSCFSNMTPSPLKPRQEPFFCQRNVGLLSRSSFVGPLCALPAVGQTQCLPHPCEMCLSLYPNCPAPPSACVVHSCGGKITFINALNSLLHFYGGCFYGGGRGGWEICDLSQEKSLLSLKNYN